MRVRKDTDGFSVDGTAEVDVDVDAGEDDDDDGDVVALEEPTDDLPVT